MTGIISDIHGNFPALREVMKALERKKVETIISLGDVVGYYSMVDECIELLRRKKVINILGNHDDYLLHGCPGFLKSKTVRMCIAYQKENIRAENIKWLQKSKAKLDMEEISFRHAGWQNLREERFEKFNTSMVKDFKQKFFVSGHSHIQYTMCEDGIQYCNPGSVGQPRDGNPDAAFSIFDGEKFELYRIPYNINEIVEDMKKKKQGEWIYRGLYTGSGI